MPTLDIFRSRSVAFNSPVKISSACSVKAQEEVNTQTIDTREVSHSDKYEDAIYRLGINLFGKLDWFSVDFLAFFRRSVSKQRRYSTRRATRKKARKQRRGIGKSGSLYFSSLIYFASRSA